MTDLIAYCPEIKEINRRSHFLPAIWSADMRAAAIIRRIKEEGTWDVFREFAFRKWCESPLEETYMLFGETVDVAFERWLTDPSTLIRMAEKWVKEQNKPTVMGEKVFVDGFRVYDGKKDVTDKIFPAPEGWILEEK